MISQNNQPSYSRNNKIIKTTQHYVIKGKSMSQKKRMAKEKLYSKMAIYMKEHGKTT